MKNLLALFLCLSVIAFANTVCFKNDLSNCNGNVTVVSDLKKSYPVYASVIESGGKSYITADIQYLNTFQKNIKNIYGITLKLKNVSVNLVMLNFQKNLFGSSYGSYKQNVDTVVLNKEYIISCSNS